MDLYAPSSAQAKRKWESESESVRRRVERDYQRAVMAHEILSSPSLRQQYDAGRIIPGRAAGPRPANPATTAASDAPMSWADQVKVAARKVEQVEEEDDSAASDADSTTALYWGQSGQN